MQRGNIQPIGLTVNPRLDAALQAGWDAWNDTARDEGADRVGSWLAQRFRNPAIKTDLRDTVEPVWSAGDVEEQAFALADLAEIAEAYDALIADTLWEGVLAAGLADDNPDLIIEATTHLAAIAEDYGDPLAAAEYLIDFLNWRRQDDHTSEIEAVETAFDEIIRLARIDGDPRAAALFEFRQAQFTRLAEADEERATNGDWERDAAPYQSWA